MLGQGMTGRLFGAALVLTAGLAAADDGAFHGSLSRTPARRWEDGFVSGNGRLGAVLFGDPRNTTLAANQCRLFLPLGNRELVPDLARYVPEMRQIFAAKGYQAAMDFFLSKAKAQGYPGLVWTDPYHPGLFVNLRYEPAGAITGFERSENFATGEVVERWRDDRGE